MALPSLAPVSALEIRLGLAVGSLSGADLARAEADLADVSALIRREAGTSWLDADGVTVTAPDDVVTVAVRAAKRSYGNPDGYLSENLGGAYVYTRFQDEGTGVFLTASEIRTVKAAAKAEGAGSGFTGSIRTPSAYYDPATDEGTLGGALL